MHVPVWLPTVPIAPHRADPGLDDVNDVPLTRKLLKQALFDLSERLYRSFRRQVRLVVHGGAVMVLHPLFSHRKSTQDVDYIHRSFVSEYRALGFSRYTTTTPTPYHGDRSKVGLGADWMNDHADVALSWTLECVMNPDLWLPFTLNGFFMLLQPTRTHIRFDLQRLDAAPKCCVADYIQRARPHAFRFSLAVGLVCYTKQHMADLAAVLRPGVVRRGVR